MISPRFDYVRLHFIVLIWGFTAVLGKLVSISSFEVVLYRTGITTIGLLAILILLGKPMRVSGQGLRNMLATGLIIAVHWILFFASARLSSISISLVGMATCAFWTSILEPIMTRRKFKLFEVLIALLVIGGICFIYSLSAEYALGLTVAMGSALLASVFTIINGKLIKQHNAYVITLYEMLGAFMGCLLIIPFYLLWTGELSIALPTNLEWGWLALLGLVCTVYPFAESVELMKRLSAYTINLTVNLEPVYGIVLALLIFGEKEHMTSNFYIGAAIIIIAVMIYPVLDRWDKKRRIIAEAG